MRFITNSLRQGKKTLLVMTTGFALVLGFSLVAAPVASAITIGGPSDCDNNAVIRCGAHSTAALKSAYNSSAYTQKVFAAFGVSSADMANLDNTNVAGRVTKDGNVFVDGQSRAVAVNAVTGGRQNMPGSTAVNTGGITFYQRPPSVSFQQQSLPAFVAMKNNQFQFAIIASCGNAVKAVPTKQPTTAVAAAKPVSKPMAKAAPKKPVPAPTQSQSQSQSQSQQVNVSNTNNTQVTNQKEAPQPAAPSTQQQPTTQTSSEQPAAQQTASQPTSLVNTGPTGLVGAFLVSSLAGVLGFRRFLTHRIDSEL